MTLRLRLLLTIGITLVILLFGIHELSQRVMSQSFEALERSSAQRNSERAANTLGQMVDELTVTSNDWATWTDTYRFMGGENPEYVDANLVGDSLNNIGIDLMAFVSETEQSHHSVVVKRGELDPPNAREVVSALRSSGGFKASEPFGDGKKGLIMLSGTPMMISIRPIHDTACKAPRRGWLVLGRYLDRARLDLLRSMTRLNVDVVPVGPQMSADAKSALREIGPSGRLSVMHTNETTLWSYGLVRDMGGRDALVLRVAEPRSIYLEGLASVNYLARLILLVGIAFAVVVIVVIERFALSRLSSLGAQVQWVGTQGGPSRVTLRGRDELGMLAGKINEMLENLDQAQAVRESEAMLRVNNEALSELVLERTSELTTKNAVLENAVEGISQVDAEGRFVESNSAFGRMVSCEAHELKGTAWTRRFPESDEALALDTLRRATQYGKAEAEVEVVRQDRQPMSAAITIIPNFDEAGAQSGFHLLMKDVTERKQMEREIESLAFHDKLTGLPNRALFLDRMALALTRASRSQLQVATIFLDLDNFKLVNDSLGHDAGDLMLQTVAQRLRVSVRPGDTVARLGGDEFTVLLEDLEDPADAEVVALRIRESLYAPINLGDRDAYASASLGIAFASRDAATPKALLKNADTAMYHAKAQGRACHVMFEESMNDSATERMELETDLRTALEHNEIFVEYQPVVDLRTGQVTGAEALARWRHPTRGIISPSRFIPLAEDTGLIVPLGQWVLTEACRQTVKWQRKLGLPNFRANVNLSGRQIERRDLVQKVRQALEETGLEPSTLTLEITETVLMRDPATVCARLNEIRELGVEIALDDFGTGYSSLATLARFPISNLKIDRGFIARLEEGDQGARSMVQAIVALSRSLSMSVTGEGIETGFQLESVRDLGCEAGQGYLFARPLSAKDLGRFLGPEGTRELALLVGEPQERDIAA